MGIFGAIGSFVSGAARAVKSVVKTVAEWIGDKIGETESYSKSSSGISSTVHMQELLTEFSLKAEDNARKLEQDCITYIENYFDEVLWLFQDESKEIRVAVDLRGLERTRKSIRNSINGAVREPLAKRMSLDDRECLDILSMSSGSDKKRCMDAFSNKVIAQALDNLASKIRETLDEQNDTITEFLEDYLDAKEKNLQNLQSQYKELEEQFGTNENKNKELLLKSWEKIGVSEILLDQI